MIGLLRGTVVDGCVLTACGVGYVVHTVDELTDGDEVRLVVHHVLSESASTLYGFPSTSVRDVFVALTKVQGVAGKTALGLLADLGAAGVARAVAAGDAKALTAAKGVGPKVAAKIVSMVSLPDVDLGDVDGEAAAGDELADALVALGYSDAAAADAAARARSETSELDLPVEQQLKVALAHLRAA